MNLDKEELISLAGDILDTIAREDAEKSFEKTGKTVVKTTARKVCVDKIMGVHPMKYLHKRGEL